MNKEHHTPIRMQACVCCLNSSISQSIALLSTFLSKRALQSEASTTHFYSCNACGYKWSERGLTDEEAVRLYSGYRGEDYFQERHQHEPWYSRKLNDGIGAEGDMSLRRKTLFEVLAIGKVNINALNDVADHGGDRGQMLLDFKNATKMVYDVSGVALEDGVEPIVKIEDKLNSFDLVLTCHVLEHLNAPLEGLQEAISLAKSGGYVYIELPFESWSGPWQPKFQQKLIHWLIQRPRLLMWADFIFTGMRIKLGWIPPMGFNVIREHLQYFSEKSITSLMKTCHLEIMHVTIKGDYLIALGKKK